VAPVIRIFIIFISTLLRAASDTIQFKNTHPAQNQGRDGPTSVRIRSALWALYNGAIVDVHPIHGRGAIQALGSRNRFGTADGLVRGSLSSSRGMIAVFSSDDGSPGGGWRIGGSAKPARLGLK